MKKMLSLLLVSGVIVCCLSGMALAAGETSVPETDAYEAPRVLVTEGVLQTLEPIDGDGLAVGEIYVPKDADAPLMVVSEEDGSVIPFASGKLHIPVTDYTSTTSDYNESFSCKPGDGNRLNIWVRNNGEDTVVLNVDWSKFFGMVDEQYEGVEIAAGDQYTMTFYYKDGSGIDGNWDVNVTTLSGGTLDITVSARQYQKNG